MADIIINRNPGFNKIIAFNGQTDFDFTFPIFGKEHLIVIKNTYTMLTLDTDYAITTPVQQQIGGTIKLTVPALAGDTITLILSPPVERTTDFQPGGDFIAGVLNTQLDLITQMIQANKRDIERSIKADFAENPDLLVEQLFEAAEETVQFAKGAEAAKTEALAAAASAVTSAGSAASSALNAANSAAGAATAANTATTKAAEAVTAADSALGSAATALSSATTASGAAQTATAAATSATQSAASALSAAGTASLDAAAAAQSAAQAAQFEILPATAERLGVVKIGDGLAVDAEGVVSAVGSSAYVTEFRDFYEQAPAAGWMVRNGGVIVNASITAPKLYAALQLAENVWKLKTEAEWQALSVAAGGIGGAPFFVLDTGADSIRLPDTRGDYARCAGSAFLQDVGAWHGDAIRNFTGRTSGGSAIGTATGVFYNSAQIGGFPNGSNHAMVHSYFDPSREVPTASENRTRAFAMLGCVYVGV